MTKSRRELQIGQRIRLICGFKIGFDSYPAGTRGVVIDRWDSSGFRWASVAAGRREPLILDLDADAWEEEIRE